MDIMLGAILILILGLTRPHHAKPLQETLDSSNTSVGVLPSGLAHTTAMQFSIPNAKSYTTGDMSGPDQVGIHDANLKRVTRGAKSGRSREREKQDSHNFRDSRPHDPEAFFTTPRNVHLPNNTYREGRNDTNSVRIHNPLYPVTDSSYGAYAVMLLSLMVFAVGIVGNLAVMCIVWHNYYMKTAWNCILASLAFWDFLVLFFCLPVVIFNELTKRRLLGDLSCRIVPYMEVTSLGVATFSLCALSIDRFHTATSTQPKPRLVEPCQSILAKLSVIWVGSMVLAIPELLLWQLQQEVAPVTGLPVDSCVRRPSVDLPESVYSLVLTYHEARMWWSFGCFYCLPLLFTLACHLLTRHVAEESRQAGVGRPLSSSTTSSSSSSSSSSPKRQQRRRRERQLTHTVLALATMFAVCGLPENAANITLAYAGLEVSVATMALLQLIGQFLMFARAAATPVILLCLCRAIGQAFMDCCCCCCDECLPDRSSSSTSSSSSSTHSTAATATSSSSPTSSVPEDKLKIVSGTTPAIIFDKAKDNSSILALGTPC